VLQTNPQVARIACRSRDARGSHAAASRPSETCDAGCRPVNERLELTRWQPIQTRRSRSNRSPRRPLPSRRSRRPRDRRARSATWLSLRNDRCGLAVPARGFRKVAAPATKPWLPVAVGAGVLSRGQQPATTPIRAWPTNDAANAVAQSAPPHPRVLLLAADRAKGTGCRRGGWCRTRGDTQRLVDLHDRDARVGVVLARVGGAWSAAVTCPFEFVGAPPTRNPSP
jgi:hypothetical protein